MVVVAWTSDLSLGFSIFSSLFQVQGAHTEVYFGLQNPLFSSECVIIHVKGTGKRKWMKKKTVNEVLCDYFRQKMVTELRSRHSPAGL